MWETKDKQIEELKKQVKSLEDKVETYRLKEEKMKAIKITERLIGQKIEALNFNETGSEIDLIMESGEFLTIKTFLEFEPLKIYEIKDLVYGKVEGLSIVLK